MKYPPIANLINVIFLILIVVVPVSYCINSTSLNDDAFGVILLMSFILMVIVLADWYHMYITNKFISLVFYMLLGVIIATGCIAVVSFVNKSNVKDLALLRMDSWEGYRLLFRGYLVGIGISFCTIISVPRLLLIKLVTNEELPENG